MGEGSFGKAVRGFIETRHDRLGREKIVVSGTDGSVRRHNCSQALVPIPLGARIRNLGIRLNYSRKEVTQGVSKEAYFVFIQRISSDPAPMTWRQGMERLRREDANPCPKRDM